MSDADLATWRSRAESARVETPSGLVLQGKTAEVQKIVVNGADGKIDWKATAMAREVSSPKGDGEVVFAGRDLGRASGTLNSKSCLKPLCYATASKQLAVWADPDI
jgi:hypothetical protein